MGECCSDSSPELRGNHLKVSTADQRLSPLGTPQMGMWQLSDVLRISLSPKSCIFPPIMADGSLSVRPRQRCPKLSAPNEVKQDLIFTGLNYFKWDFT